METPLKSFKEETPESSSVSSIAWDSETKIFSITFKSNGSTYEYAGVTADDALSALHSKSYGRLAKVELKAYKGAKKED